MVPYVIARIVDRAGEVLEDNWPSPRDAIRADTAYIMVSLMRGVVQRGTGVGALQLGWPVGGKTGTVDDYTDAWFVGFDAEITVGVWVGYDEKKTLGTGEQGARVALPIWRDFMQAYIDARVTQGAPEGFVPPDNMVNSTGRRNTSMMRCCDAETETETVRPGGSACDAFAWSAAGNGACGAATVLEGDRAGAVE